MRRLWLVAIMFMALAMSVTSYGDDCLVLFYETSDMSYGYTEIWRIDKSPSMAGVFGGGRVSVGHLDNNCLLYLPRMWQCLRTVYFIMPTAVFRKLPSDR